MTLFVVPMLAVLLGLAVLGLAVLTFARPSRLSFYRPSRPRRGWDWLLGAGLTLAGCATLASAHVPILAFFAAVLDCIALLGFWLMPAHRAALPAALPAALVAASVCLGVLQPFGLKVLLLPKAAALPYAPVPAQTLKTYAPGQWFESVRVGADGTIYLSVNHGDDYATGDKSHAQGQVIARAPNGTERTVFTLPVGSTSGVIAIAPDGTLYLTGTGAELGIWRISPQGNATLFAPLPRGAWPNGLDFGPDGMLYSADSSLGLVWRIDPRDGRVERAVESRRLAARPYIALAPGANGIHFRGHEMIVTVSDSTEVLSFPWHPDGTLGEPTLLADGIPGDDFAVAPDGSLYITTHPYNTVVRVAPDGQRTVIANAQQNIVGATDASFGRTPQDADTLYVATDGGAFQGGASARGALVALKIGQP